MRPKLARDGTAGSAKAPHVTDPTPFVAFDDDPDLPGWKRWQFRDATRFNAFLEPIHVRTGEGRAIVRMTPRREHSNMRNAVHGGALLGFIDVALFAGCRGMGLLEAGGAVTVDLTAQFIGEAVIDRPIEAEVELLRETRRLIFLRGLVGQEEARVASFSATIRKMAPDSLSPSGERE
jgi:uncharacterized protein (TIGR00369 family)